MSGGGGQAPAPAPSQPTTQTITTNPIADWAQPTANALIGTSMSNAFNMDPSGNILSSRGFTPFGGQTNAQGQFTGSPISQDQYNQQLQVAGLGVAGPSALQQQSYQGAANLQVPGQYQPATAAAGYGTMQSLGAGQNYAQQATDPNAVGAYMNPYIQNALNPALALQNQQFGQIGAQNQAQATQSGAFGGGREAVMAGLNQQNQMLAQNQLVGNAYNNAFGQAQQAQQFGANLGLQGAQAGIQGANTLAGIGGQQLAAQQGVLGTQNQMGTQEQQNQQALLNQAMQNYGNQQNYGTTQTANIMNLLRSTPTTQTQTVYQAAPSAISQIGGLGATALGAYGASGGFKTNAAGGEIKEKKMASGGIASGVPAEKLPSMLEKLSDQQLAQKANLQTNDPQTAADAISQQSFRANARQGVASAAGGGFVNMASGGIVAFAKGDAVEEMGKYENPNQTTLNEFYAKSAPGTPAPLAQNQPTDENDLATRSAEYKNLLGDRSGVGAKYIEALKNAKPDKEEQMWGRLMQFGAGMAAGTSPNALTNIGAAAKETVPGMLEDTKARRQAEIETAKAQYDISNMDYSDQVNLLKLAQTDRNAFAKIAADMGMKEKELANQLVMNINTNKAHIESANIAAKASMANAGAAQNLSREQMSILEKAASPNATPEEKLKGAALEKYIGLTHPTLSGQAAVDNAQTKAIKEKIDSLQDSTLGKSKQERAAIEEQIRTLRDLLPTGGPSTAGGPPKVEVAKDNDGKTYQKPPTMPQQAWEEYKTKFNLK